MSEPGYKEMTSKEERSALRSYGNWDLIALGALVGAGFGYVLKLDSSSRVQAAAVFGGMAFGAMLVFAALLDKAGRRARKRFFTRWAGSRGWTYRASGSPFEDTPYLSSGDHREAADFFSGFWTEPEAVLYRFRRLDELAASRAISNYIVLHLSFDRPVIDLLQIWPRSRSADLGEKVLGSQGEIGEEIDLESAELAQYYRVSGSPGVSDDVRRLLTPSAIVKLLDFHRGVLSGVDSYFEIQGSAAAFLVGEELTAEEPGVIDELLELWRPIVDWLAEATGTERTPSVALGDGRSA